MNPEKRFGPFSNLRKDLNPGFLSACKVRKSRQTIWSCSHRNKISFKEFTKDVGESRTRESGQWMLRDRIGEVNNLLIELLTSCSHPPNARRWA